MDILKYMMHLRFHRTHVEPLLRLRDQRVPTQLLRVFATAVARTRLLESATAVAATVAALVVAVLITSVATAVIVIISTSTIVVEVGTVIVVVEATGTTRVAAGRSHLLHAVHVEASRLDRFQHARVLFITLSCSP